MRYTRKNVSELLETVSGSPDVRGFATSNPGWNYVLVASGGGTAWQDIYDPNHRFSGTLVMSFTPCLVQQLLACEERYTRYLHVLGRIATRELERTSRLELYNRYEKYPHPLSEEALRQLHHTASLYLRRVEGSLA